MVYLSEMFPITSFLGTLLTAFAIQLVYLRLFGIPAQYHYQMLLSGIVITAVTLLIRIMDELKDYEDDKKNFPDRPLPSGRVLLGDLKVLAAICIAAILLPGFSSKTLLLFGFFTFIYTVLMYKWFFIEGIMRKNLPLAFITHHPIVIINILYLLLGLSVSFSVDMSKAFLVLPISLIFTNWEIARKIRMPQDETSYTTYSKIFGPRPAMLVSILLQAIYTVAVFVIFSQLDSPLYLKVVFAVVMCLFFIPSFRFLFTLTLKSPLKNNAEGQILTVIGFLLAASLI